MYNETYEFPKKPDKKQIIKYTKISLMIVILLIAAGIVITSFYTVAENEQAVILTFGKHTGEVGPGLHFKLPWPIQTASFVPVKTMHKLELGYRSSNDGQDLTYANESKMITGDLNIINIDFFIEWKITDPVKYLFASDNPVNILRNVAQSSARLVIGTQKVDDALTTGKVAIQLEMLDKINLTLAAYDLGVVVDNVKIQDSQPPNAEVVTAFKNVENAKQEKETYINQAIEYRNKTLPEANAAADRIRRAAESSKESRINQAKGDVARFNEMYNEYIKQSDVTRTRMKLEMLESVLPGMQVYIDNGSGSVQKLLPLDSFTP